MQLWKGSTSCKFKGGRQHLNVQNELGSNLVPLKAVEPIGIKTFDSKVTPNIQFKPCLKITDAAYASKGAQIDLRGRKHLSLPDQVAKMRPERGHFDIGQQTNTEHQIRGIRTYEQAKRLKKAQYMLEAKLQQKARILGLEEQRNNLGLAAFGDKPYKYPQYARDFYKAGGLIAGSSGLNRKRSKDQKSIDQKQLKFIFTKPMWDVKVKMDQEEQERKVISSLDQWEDNLLKEAAKTAQTAIQGKDNKKGAKK